jgi:hypothetical protein
MKQRIFSYTRGTLHVGYGILYNIRIKIRFIYPGTDYGFKNTMKSYYEREKSVWYRRMGITPTSYSI